MKIIKNNGKIPEITTKYMLAVRIKNVNRIAYSKVNPRQMIIGFLYEVGIMNWTDINGNVIKRRKRG